MMKLNYRLLGEFKPYIIVLTIVLVILFAFTPLSLSRSKRLNRDSRLQHTQKYDKKMRLKDRNDFNLFEKHWYYMPLNRESSCPLVSKNYRKKYNRLSPEEKAMLKRRLQEWESLPEHKQQMLRRRMKKYEQLPAEKQERYQHRYRQLKKLPPDERYLIRQKLRKWDSLSPQEQEQIRRRFRNP